MKVKTLFLILLVAITLMSGSLSAQDQTIADVLAAQGGYDTFLKFAGMAGVDLTADGEFTVFAPTDEAFATIPASVTTYLASNTEELARLINYHMIEGKVTSTDVVMLLDDMGMASVTTLAGEAVTVAVNMETFAATVDQANILIELSDIEASNGVIHTIDAYLVPRIELPTIEPAFVSGDIVTAGSSTVGPLSEKIQEIFVAAGYADSINNSIIGSGAGFERFCEAGETDIANASRAIKDSEIEACGQLEPARYPIEFRVGTDALAVTVNPANDWVADVTLEELSLIFSTATTWADVREGWPEEQIIRFIPGTDSGTFDYFVEEIFDNDEEPILNANNLQLSEDDNILLEGVANNVNAVGFFGYAYYKQNADGLKLLSIEGMAATQANVDAATYPLARPLFIYSDAGIATEKPQVAEFIVYYMANVDAVIDEVGYFPANSFELNVAKLSALALISQ